jgi:hypothetical protein
MQKVAAFLGVLALASATAAAQHQRIPVTKSSSQTGPVRPIVSPQATISGPSSGIYCPDMVDKAVGVHDLGWLPAGRDVTVVLDAAGGEPAFDPVATVLVVSLGVPGGGTAKVTTFYDNDSGGDKDPQITFTTPQDGTFILLVGDNSGSSGGCYRYQLSVR